MYKNLKNNLAYHKIQDNNSVLEGGNVDEIDVEEVVEDEPVEEEVVTTGKKGKKK